MSRLLKKKYTHILLKRLKKKEKKRSTFMREEGTKIDILKYKRLKSLN